MKTIEEVRAANIRDSARGPVTLAVQRCELNGPQAMARLEAELETATALLETARTENETLKKYGSFTRRRYTGFGEDAQDCTCCGAIQNGHDGVHNPGCILAKIFHQPEAIVGNASLGGREEKYRIGVKLNNADGTETALTNETHWALVRRED